MSNLYLDGNIIKGLPRWLEKTIAVTVIALIPFLVVLFNGNPFDRSKIHKIAENYVAENYPEIAQEMPRDTQSYYNSYFNSYFGTDTGQWWDGQWYVRFESPEKHWHYFTLLLNRKGDVIFDGYKEVYSKGATIMRYNSTLYSEYFHDIFKSMYKTKSASISMYSLLSQTQAEAYLYDSSINAWDKYDGPVLDPTVEYDFKELAKEYGHLSIFFHNDTKAAITKADMTTRRNEIKLLIEENYVPFSTISIVINYKAAILDISRDEFLNSDTEYVVENYFFIEQ